uniref:hypothetical protein n=1 Tax=Rhodococcus erythropolis TaxID=1833 RepID=UPI00209BCCC2|nr:hypothetical protein [Rhodococcus erythropolis]
MAEKTGLPKSTIGRIWRKFELKPHLADGFKLSTDPQFIDKVVDVVGLYLNPPEHAVMLCVDGKSGMQALGWSQPVLPMMPGCLSGAAMISSVPVSPVCSRHSIPPTAPSFPLCTAGIGSKLRHHYPNSLASQLILVSPCLLRGSAVRRRLSARLGSWVRFRKVGYVPLRLPKRMQFL